jgi:hypothetical protein
MLDLIMALALRPRRNECIERVFWTLPITGRYKKKNENNSTDAVDVYAPQLTEFICSQRIVPTRERSGS